MTGRFAWACSVDVDLDQREPVDPLHLTVGRGSCTVVSVGSRSCPCVGVIQVVDKRHL